RGVIAFPSSLQKSVLPFTRRFIQLASTCLSNGVSGTWRVVSLCLSFFFSRIVTTPCARSTSDGRARTISDRLAPVLAAKQKIGYTHGLTGRAFTHSNNSLISFSRK